MCWCCPFGAAWLPDCSRWERESLCRAIDPTKRLYMMSRHFVWLAPLANLLLFLGLGLFLAVADEALAPAGRLAEPPAALCPGHPAGASRGGPSNLPGGLVHPGAGDRVAAGPAGSSGSQPACGGGCCLEFSRSAGIGHDPGGSVFGGDWLKQRREAGRPLPPANSPNVLLIVLDTVRADRLSLYGYQRRTTPTLERLAKRGIRFDAARATAPWTLPSHASLFTGRWPHELDVQWLTPLRVNFPMLAEYLGSHGYATAGFVANTALLFVRHRFGPRLYSLRRLCSRKTRYPFRRPPLSTKVADGLLVLTGRCATTWHCFTRCKNSFRRFYVRVSTEMPNRLIADFLTG